MSLTAGHLVIRADTRPGAGAGHALRQMALVERWLQLGGPVTMVLDEASVPLAARIRDAGAMVALSGAQPVVDAVLAPSPDVVVFDGYPFGREVQEAVVAAGPVVAAVDDHGRQGGYGAQIVVDQNLGPRLPVHDDRPSGAALLLGPRYALLRNEFRVTQADAASGPSRVVVLLGGENCAAAEDLATQIRRRLRNSDVEVTTPASAGQIRAVADLLATASVVVSAAGSTAWELCHLGLPAVLVALAENQEPVGAALARAGAAVYLGRGVSTDRSTVTAIVDAVEGLLDDPGRSSSLAAVGPTLVDGLGAARVATELRSASMVLRTACRDDARLLWEWANDEQVRNASFDDRVIGWEEHMAWFEQGLTDDRRHHYLAVAAGRPWGQVRFDDRGGGRAEISISVSAEARGNGVAGSLIRAGVRRLFTETSTTSVLARVKADNQRSFAAFLAADFDPAPDIVADGRSLVYCRGRDGRA